MSEFFIEMKNITKTFEGIVALDKMNLQVRKGTVHVIVGENGAGKSTLMRILNGANQPNSGEIILDGKSVIITNQKNALKRGISMIYQELNTVLDMSIAENIYLGNGYNWQ